VTRTPDHVHIRRRRWLISAFLLAASALLPAHAQRSMIDDLDVALEEGLVVITVRFGAPVRYLRHFPVEQGDLLEIQFQLLTNDPSATLAFDERRRVPSVQGLPTTTITYRHPVASDLLQNPPSRGHDESAVIAVSP
jgi:hypothetical protein